MLAVIQATMLFMSIIYLAVITFIYKTKKNVENLDTQIYIKLLNVTYLSIITEVILYISALVIYPLGSIGEFIFLVFSKIFIIIVMIWFTTMLKYTIWIGVKKDAIESNKNLDNQLENRIIKKFKRDQKKINIITIIAAIITLLLKVEFIVNGSSGYTSGLATTFAFVQIIIINIIILIKLIQNKHKIKKIEFIPIIFLFILMTISTIIQASFPELLLFNPVMTLVTIIMYHTIENPDVKMLEEVSIAKEQAEKANNAKSDFLSNMSHEIRTPLNAIVGFSESLKEDNLSEDSKNKVADIITASNNLLEIVNGILDISKIEANKLEIINKEYDIHSMLDELVSLTKARIGTKELSFKVSIDQALPSVLYGDNTRLKQIILNLLTNAVKYTKEGSIFFTVSTVVKDNICRLIISVEDTGIGMKEESLQKLFTKFERLNVEKQITIEGTGLGLAITKKLVDLMNGKIIVQSVYGKGSKFTVSIDQRIISVERPLAKQPAKSESKVIDANGAKILLVDDNELNIKVASTLLKKYNFVIESCTSAFACIAKIKDKNEYDIILMDDMMPKMTGKEAVKVLKNEMNYKKPIIVLTANAITGMREEYLAAGFDDYLSKPIEKKELERVIKEHIHKTNSTSINTSSSLSTNSIISNKIDIDLPVLSKPQPVETQTTESEYEGKKILLVDDNELNIKVALTVLKKYNLDITTVMSGSECIEKVIDNKYDLVLLDDMMPELDGCTTLDNLKTLDNFNTPVVMMTASSKDEIQNKLIEHCFDGYLSKPFKKEDLDEILKTLLN